MHYLIAILLTVLFAVPALGGESVSSRILLPTTTITPSTERNIYFNNDYARSAYLITNLTNEVGDCSFSFTTYMSGADTSFDVEASLEFVPQ
jgi:hypothetical protein